MRNLFITFPKLEFLNKSEWNSHVQSWGAVNTAPEMKGRAMIFGELGLPQSPLDELWAPVRPTHRASPQHSWVGGSREVGVPCIHTHHTGLQLLKVSSIRTAQTSLNRDSLGKPTFFPLLFAFLISFLLPKFLTPPLSWQHSMSPPLLPDVSRSRTFCGILEIFPAPSSS